MRRSEAGDEFPAKDVSKDRNRQEEARAGMDPPRAVRRQAAHGHDAVDVGMMLETLPPRVEHHEPANSGAEAFRIRRDPQQRLRGRPKQEVVDDALVGERQARQRLRHREDDMDVADGQELRFPGRHPGVPRGGQAPGTMAVPAAVVREGRLRTLLTSIAVPTERRGAALRDRAEHTAMRPGHPGVVGLQEAIAACRRTMSATSKGGRLTAGASAETAARCQAPRS